MKQLDFDTIILGGGPAGLSAGIYSARGAVSTAIVDKNMFGGQPSNYLELENYPGFPIVGGYDLMEKIEEHADKFGIQKFPMQEIEKVDLISKKIYTKEYEFSAKTIIIATGAQPMKLGVKGEKEFVGRGVSYCAVCDGAFYKNKVVAVIGGGNSAIEEAMYLTKFASKVFVVHRRNELRADKIIQERAFKNEKIEFEEFNETPIKEVKVKNEKPKNNKKLKFSFNEQREFDTIDDDIATLEEKIEKLNNDTSKYATDFTKLQEIMDEKEKLEKELEHKYERWEYLNNLAEEIAAQK